MFQQLSHYLLQYNRVTIPTVGTIQLVAQPARLDIASHLIYPPYYVAAFSADDELSEHQLEYFTTSQHNNADAAYRVLKRLGGQLKNKIQNQPFEWSGIGRFEYQNHQIVFYPTAENQTLPPVQANRVIREKAQHSVLVGDQVVMSDEAGEQLYEEKRRRDYFIIAAWVLGILALLFIGYFLYQRQFQSTASGLQRKVQPGVEAPTYK